ncbi:phosphopentomutase [Abyssisolibacter fermentans]|uniref:phosphopentomutase n=1 Tax=Abyssisolibacter fermentans TaxID=1766203 RepID=UPI001FA74579|nr:phosphopentomutase [Abyssisolibacter fermentans]
MMKKFVVLILDGFGVGWMDDVLKVRPQDYGANTLLHILESKKDLKLVNLERLGLMNVINKETNVMKKSQIATFGSANLKHFGADTFWGHQEILGSKPLMPVMEPISNRIDNIKKELENKGYKVEEIFKEDRKLLMVNNALTIADNIETDLGQAYNVTAALDFISFEEVVKVGRIARSLVDVSRVIVFGGHGVTKQDILDAIEIKGDKYIGVNAPKSGVYRDRYHCIHLGYKVDYKEQLPYNLNKNGVKTTLIGKVADIVENQYGESIPVVDTKEAMMITLNEIQKSNGGFICTNIQETDLSGHEENVEKYAKKLKIVDDYLTYLIKELDENDILLIMADHGNDPTIGHSKHTRERVPILVYNKNLRGSKIGVRETLSDVAATVSDYFGAEKMKNGESFLNKIH